MERLDGAKVIVTGGTSGMGEAVALAFPELGAEVVFFGRNKDAGKRISKKSGATFMPLDIKDTDATKAAIDEAAAKLGGLDVLIHAAGIAPFSAAEEITMENWIDVMSTNATSTYITNVAAFPYLKDEGGVILNFTSSGGIQGYVRKAHYGASKGAVTAWSRSIAMEWAQYGIRVNMIAPAIWTPMYDKTRAAMTPEQLSAHDKVMAASVPLGGKLGDLDTDYVPVMAFLSSDSSKFITGQVVCIDGGILMMR
ncbi:MAG: SDR family oxidoreductase [Clostridiales Family XIII bacterium]|jgi:NAD(P)-dependent dehydrogenase (short-subunit alcohol dehydrogenase family)|nr:SDR family oxidoreductase [Clostridiales Family XIII bacterium]